VEIHDEVRLRVPTHSDHRRIARLLVAEAGERAGFDMSELDDLRTVTDELLEMLMGAAEEDVVLQLVVDGERLTVRGSGRRRPDATTPTLPAIAELMVDAITDRYSLDDVDGTLSFVLEKHRPRVVS